MFPAANVIGKFLTLPAYSMIGDKRAAAVAALEQAFQQVDIRLGFRDKTVYGQPRADDLIGSIPYFGADETIIDNTEAAVIILKILNKYYCYYTEEGHEKRGFD